MDCRVKPGKSRATRRFVSPKGRWGKRHSFAMHHHHAPMASDASSNANATNKRGKTPAIARGKSTKGTNTKRSMTEAATICRAPERPPNT